MPNDPILGLATLMISHGLIMTLIVCVGLFGVFVCFFVVVVFFGRLVWVFWVVLGFFFNLLSYTKIGLFI